MTTGQLPPRSQPLERERAIVDALLKAVQEVPRLAENVERLEQAVLVASSAAARAEQAVQRLEEVVSAIRGGNGNGDRPISRHDLDRFAHQVVEEVKETVEEATTPGLERVPTPSDRVRQTIALDAHARWVRLRDTVLGGLALAGIIELVRILVESLHH
jgi:hypothetical protein